MNNTESLNQLVSNTEWQELYNCYAAWITDPRNKQMYFTTGGSKVKKNFETVEKPHGFRSFLKTFLPMKQVIRIEQHCCKLLQHHPEIMQERGGLFVEMFPTVIKHKISKKNVKERRAFNKLNQVIEQKTLELNHPPVKEPVADATVQKIREFVAAGAKKISTPDGWEIQF
jgi:hypothetical protein